MDFPGLLQHYFGSPELDALTLAVLDAGQERIRVDLGLETEPARRFALWALLYMLGDRLDLDTTFSDPAEREAARNFMDRAESFAPDKGD